MPAVAAIGAFAGTTAGAATIAAGASLAGAALSSRASKKAAGTQAAAADRASAIELEKFNQAREDQAPWRDRGNLAGERLNYLLGLSGGGQGGQSGTPQTREQIRQSLLSRYTTPATGGADSELARRDKMDYDRWMSAPFDDRGEWNPNWDQYFKSPDGLARWVAPQMTPERVDEAGLNAAVEAEFARRQSGQNAMVSDPEYGSLLRRFSAADLQADPVYQSGLEFGLSEGRSALQRMASARGGLNSGATLKALTRFANDYGSTRANESYNRFTNDATNIYNRLAGVSGTGQTSAAQIGNQAIQTGQSIGQNTMGAADARASGYVGGANALTGAIGQGINTWQQNRLIDRMTQPSYGNFLANNAGIMNQGLSSNDLIRGF